MGDGAGGVDVGSGGDVTVVGASGVNDTGDGSGDGLAGAAPTGTRGSS